MAGWKKEKRTFSLSPLSSKSQGSFGAPQERCAWLGQESIRMGISLFWSRENEYVLTWNKEFKLLAEPASSSGHSCHQGHLDNFLKSWESLLTAESDAPPAYAVSVDVLGTGSDRSPCCPLGKQHCP